MSKSGLSVVPNRRARAMRAIQAANQLASYQARQLMSSCLSLMVQQNAESVRQATMADIEVHPHAASVQMRARAFKKSVSANGK